MATQAAQLSSGEWHIMSADVDAAITQAYQRYFPMVRAKCLRMVRDPAEAQDLAQETFIRLWANRRSLRDARAVTSWVYRTSTRLAIDHCRKTKRTDVSDTAGDGEGPSFSPDDQAAARILLEQFAGKLPEKELAAAILSRVDGMTHPEIGEVLGTSERNVRRLLKRLETRIEKWRLGQR